MLRHRIPASELNLQYQRGLLRISISAALADWLDEHCPDQWKLRYFADNGYWLQFETDAAFILFKMRWT
jgi:hypothetical protein